MAWDIAILKQGYDTPLTEPVSVIGVILRVNEDDPIDAVELGSSNQPVMLAPGKAAKVSVQVAWEDELFADQVTYTTEDEDEFMRLIRDEDVA